jgi:large subunit ribosomal protein L15
MTVNKTKKVSRYRGSKTHGGGHMKKRRGAGNRGGRGMAGSGKRADQKKPTILKKFGNSYFGKTGFKRPQKVMKEIVTMNVDYLNTHLDDFVKAKLAKLSGDTYEIDLTKLGCQKLLGRGDLTQKVKVSVPMISKKAIEKIKNAGGEAIGNDGSTE